MTASNTTTCRTLRRNQTQLQERKAVDKIQKHSGACSHQSTPASHNTQQLAAQDTTIKKTGYNGAASGMSSAALTDDGRSCTNRRKPTLERRTGEPRSRR